MKRKLNPAQRAAVWLLIAAALLPVAIVSGWRKARHRIRAGRLSLPANRS